MVSGRNGWGLYLTWVPSVVNPLVVVVVRGVVTMVVAVEEIESGAT